MACLINVQSKLSIDPQDHITKLMYRKINMILRQNLVMGPRRGVCLTKKVVNKQGGEFDTIWDWQWRLFSVDYLRLMQILMQ